MLPPMERASRLKERAVRRVFGDEIFSLETPPRFHGPKLMMWSGPADPRSVAQLRQSRSSPSSKPVKFAVGAALAKNASRELVNNGRRRCGRTRLRAELVDVHTGGHDSAGRPDAATPNQGGTFAKKMATRRVARGDVGPTSATS